VWWKVKARTTLDMVAIGFTGTVAGDHPRLAFPGVLDDTGQLVTAGSTTILTRSSDKLLAPLLRLSGERFERTFAWGLAEPATGSSRTAAYRDPGTVGAALDLPRIAIAAALVVAALAGAVSYVRHKSGGVRVPPPGTLAYLAA